LAEGCLKLNQALQGLLTMAYELIYEDSANGRAPTFSIPLAPNLPYELLLPLFDAQVLDETAYNRLFEASVGFSLGEHALKAREDRHKALTVVKTAASGGAAKKE